jgi:dolichol kinase
MPAVASEEIQRKILHFFSGLILALGIFYIPQWVDAHPAWRSVLPGWAYPPVVLGGTLAIHLVFEYLRMQDSFLARLFQKWFGSMLRKNEAKSLTGSTYINAGALLCSLAFRQDPHISFMVLLMFIWGDAAAALVGQGIGRIKIGAKSLEGSVACFILCVILMGALFPHVPGLLEAWHDRIPLPLILLAPLAITLLELFPLKIGPRFEINDNLYVPLVTGYIIRMVYGLL